MLVGLMNLVILASVISFILFIWLFYSIIMIQIRLKAIAERLEQMIGMFDYKIKTELQIKDKIS